MLSIDQFESAFRAAAKTHFHAQPITVERVMVITDLDLARADRYAERVTPLLSVFDDPTIVAIPGSQSQDIEGLLARIRQHDPQLIVTYRCLHSLAWQLPYTVGDHIEVLTQVTDVPVLLLPRVDTGHASSEPLIPPRCVMAMTDHLVGDDRLVSWASTLASERLVLTHIEDDDALARTMHFIERIPEISTDLARRKLPELMLAEARDWIASCRATLESRLVVEEVVQLGGRLSTYRELIDARDIDLLVLNTKDNDQLAIHGMAWPLMIELRHVPMLLL